MVGKYKDVFFTLNEYHIKFLLLLSLAQSTSQDILLLYVQNFSHEENPNDDIDRSLTDIIIEENNDNNLNILKDRSKQSLVFTDKTCTTIKRIMLRECDEGLIKAILIDISRFPTAKASSRNNIPCSKCANEGKCNKHLNNHCKQNCLPSCNKISHHCKKTYLRCSEDLIVCCSIHKLCSECYRQTYPDERICIYQRFKKFYSIIVNLRNLVCHSTNKTWEDLEGGILNANDFPNSTDWDSLWEKCSAGVVKLLEFKLNEYAKANYKNKTLTYTQTNFSEDKRLIEEIYNFSQRVLIKKYVDQLQIQFDICKQISKLFEVINNISKRIPKGKMKLKFKMETFNDLSNLRKEEFGVQGKFCEDLTKHIDHILRQQLEIPNPEDCFIVRPTKFRLKTATTNNDLKLKIKISALDSLGENLLQEYEDPNSEISKSIGKMLCDEIKRKIADKIPGVEEVIISDWEMGSLIINVNILKTLKINGGVWNAMETEFVINTVKSIDYKNKLYKPFDITVSVTTTKTQPFSNIVYESDVLIYEEYLIKPITSMREDVILAAKSHIIKKISQKGTENMETTTSSLDVVSLSITVINFLILILNIALTADYQINTDKNEEIKATSKSSSVNIEHLSIVITMISTGFFIFTIFKLNLVPKINWNRIRFILPTIVLPIILIILYRTVQQLNIKQNITYKYNPNNPLPASFTNRIEILAKLHQNMMSNKQTKRFGVVVTGSPGVGKTVLSRRYCEMYNRIFNKNIIWIDAVTRKSTEIEFLKIAKIFSIHTNKIGTPPNLKAIVTKIYNYFSGTKVLFVFNDANKEDVTSFLPKTYIKGIYLLLTSQDNIWDDRQFYTITLNVLTSRQAASFIDSELHESEGLNATNRHQLLKVLDNHPLALQQAVSYIKNHNNTIDNFLEAMQNQNTKQVVMWCKHDTSCSVVMKTLISALQRIKKDYKNKVAVQLLYHMSFLNGKNIKKGIFYDTYGGDKTTVNDALMLLHQFSLISLTRTGSNTKMNDDADQVIQITYIVQVVISHYTKGRNLYQCKFKALLNKVFFRHWKSSESIYHHNFGRYWYKHFIHILYNKEMKQQLIANTMLQQDFVIKVLISKGKWSETFDYLTEIETELMKQKDQNNTQSKLLLLKTRFNIANVYLQRNNIDKAYTIFKVVIKQQMVILGSSHADVFTTEYSIALCLNMKGNVHDALSKFQRIGEKRLKLLGSAHPDLLKTQHQIANCLVKTGKLDKALSMFRKVHEAQKSILGSTHPDFLTTRLDLANAMMIKGNVDSALVMQIGVAKTQLDILGTRHQNTLATQKSIIVTLERKGLYKQALEIYHQLNDKITLLFGHYHLQLRDLTETLKKLISEKDKTHDFQPFSKSQNQCLTFSTYLKENCIFFSSKSIWHRY